VRAGGQFQTSNNWTTPKSRLQPNIGWALNTGHQIDYALTDLGIKALYSNIFSLKVDLALLELSNFLKL
jgi:hypothetical protein